MVSPPAPTTPETRTRRNTADYLTRCHDLHRDATRLLGSDRVHLDPTTTMLHSYDASLEYGRPDLVVAPRDTEDLRALVEASTRHRVPYVMRGAGSGYSGGALPARGGMVILTAGLDRILETNFDEGWIRCEPGVVLAAIQQCAGEAGWRYMPDPSSHQVCTIGGNLAENAGGPHALGAGPTSNYVTAVDLVRPDGTVVVLDEQRPWEGDLDLRSVIIGSEGTLGAMASATLRLVRAPETERVVLATFTRQQDALAAVTDVFDTGLLPSAMDMLTGGFVPSQPDFADPSLLFVGLQGHDEEVAEQSRHLARCVRAQHGAFELLDVAAFLPRRAELVREKVRRMVATTGCPRYYLFDAVAPRSNLARLMESIRDAAREFALPVLNTFHAGDGNVHPTPFYDPASPGYQTRLREFSNQVLRECRDMGGGLSGEHGVGLEKQDLMAEFYSPATLTVMHGIKRAFDPDELSNPGKILPAKAPPPARTQARVPAPETPVDRLPPQLHRVDALLEVTDPATTFGDLDTAVSGSPYELPYEPLTGSANTRVLAAIDAGLPAIREAGPARARDLIVGADLHRGDDNESAPLVQLGGLCAKDVAGYELRKLVYGARGRLGRLARIRLRLLPRPSDSQLACTSPMPLDDAISLCRRVNTAALPFSYLGVLVNPAGTAIVTGRLDLRGGALGRHLDRLRAVETRQDWTFTASPRWDDPAMLSFAATTQQLTGQAGLAWTSSSLLHDLARNRTEAFASIGHRRIFWRGLHTPAEPSALTVGTIAAFRTAP